MSFRPRNARRTTILGYAAAAILLAFSFAAAGASSALADSTGSISGTVYEGTGDSAVPAANAFVALDLPGGTYVQNATTDANGDYSFTGLPAASYVIDFQANYGDNFSSQWWNNEPTQSTATPIALASGQALTDIDANLAAGATVSGQVETSAGPATYSSVSVVDAEGDYIASGATDGNGDYSINALPAGSFTVEFTDPTDSSLPAQYWNDSSSLAGATFFTTTPGSSVTDIDAFFTAASQGTASISGTVYDPANPGSGLPFENVQALNPDGSTAGSTQTADDGTYTISGLSAGSYTLEFSSFGANAPQWWQNEPSFAAADFFSVADGQALTGYDAQIAVGGTISGTVYTGAAGHAPLQNIYVTVEQDGQDLGYEPGVTDSNGDYTITGLAPGNYEVNFQAPYGTSYVSQWWNGSTTAAGSTEVAVAAGGSVTGINATMAVGATISGTVSGRAANGTVFPAPNAQPSLYSSDGTLINNYSYADLNGNYSIGDLPAGSYTLYFVPQPGTTDFVPQWWKNKTSEATATVITLKAGQTRSNIDPILASTTLKYPTPKISGAAKVGSTLSAKPGKWGPGTVTLSYQWSRNGQPVDGATSATYSLTNADANATISVTVTGSESGYTTASATSASTKAVTGGALSAGTPTIQGTAAQGQVLTASPGTWGPGTVNLTYKWFRGSSRIAGATSATYTLGRADVGKEITVRVAGSEAGFTTKTVTSAPTSPVS